MLLFILIVANTCSKVEEKSIFSSGQITVHGTCGCDLDLGIEADDPGRDFKWGNEPPSYMQPKNNGKLFIVGTTDLSTLEYEALTGYAYSTDRIEGSQLPVGTVVAAITSQGRYCKFRIDINRYDLTITWVTYVL
jgi:hypothetical protein